MTEATQLKVTLPLPLYDFLNSKASRFGLTLSSYVKNLIINDVKDMAYPTYQASGKVEKSYKKALKEKDKAVEVEDLEHYFNNL